MFTISQAAKRLGVSTVWLRRQLWNGKLAHVRFGRSIRISESAIAEFTAANTVTAKGGV